MESAGVRVNQFPIARAKQAVYLAAREEVVFMESMQVMSSVDMKKVILAHTFQQLKLQLKHLATIYQKVQAVQQIQLELEVVRSLPSAALSMRLTAKMAFAIG